MSRDQYQGPERRANSTVFTDDEKKLLFSAVGSGYKIFGFKIQELVVVGTLLVTIIAFYVRTDNAMNRLIKVSDYLIDFTKNSDNWHSSQTGITFNQGKPDGTGSSKRWIKAYEKDTDNER